MSMAISPSDYFNYLGFVVGELFELLRSFLFVAIIFGARFGFYLLINLFMKRL